MYKLSAICSVDAIYIYILYAINRFPLVVKHSNEKSPVHVFFWNIMYQWFKFSKHAMFDYWRVSFPVYIGLVVQ